MFWRYALVVMAFRWATVCGYTVLYVTNHAASYVKPGVKAVWLIPFMD